MDDRADEGDHAGWRRLGRRVTANGAQSGSQQGDVALCVLRGQRCHSRAIPLLTGGWLILRCVEKTETSPRGHYPAAQVGQLAGVSGRRLANGLDGSTSARRGRRFHPSCMRTKMLLKQWSSMSWRAEAYGRTSLETPSSNCESATGRSGHFNARTSLYPSRIRTPKGGAEPSP